MQMRRLERSLTTLDEITAVLDKCLIARFGLVDAEGPYVVPVHFAYRLRDGRFTIYSHGAPTGRKIAALTADPRCCVEIDRLDGLIDDGTGACSLSAAYESVIGFGRARVVDDPQEAHEAIAAIVARQAPDQVSTLPDTLPAHVAIIAVDLDEVTGKTKRA